MGVKLFIAMPVYGAVQAPTVQSLLKLMAVGSPQITFRMEVGDSMISRARNTLVAEFLKTDCTHILFIDSDEEFEPADVERIAACPKPIVGGLVAKKVPGPPVWCSVAYPGTQPSTDGLLEVRYIGTGFLRIARHVFTSVEANEYVYENGETHRDWFGPMVLDGHLLPEDYAFIYRAGLAGFKAYADLGIQVRHFGNTGFPINTQPKEKA